MCFKDIKNILKQAIPYHFDILVHLSSSGLKFLDNSVYADGVFCLPKVKV